MTFTQDFTGGRWQFSLVSYRRNHSNLLFWALAINKMKGYVAGVTTLLVSLVLAVIAFEIAGGHCD